MDFRTDDLGGGITRVTLTGAFDIAGAADVDMPFAVLSGRHDRVVVDLTGVDFLASIGVRVLVKAARTIGNRGGRMVLVNPAPAARKVLVTTGVDQMVPIVEDEAAALEALA